MYSQNFYGKCKTNETSKGKSDIKNAGSNLPKFSNLTTSKFTSKNDKENVSKSLSLPKTNPISQSAPIPLPITQATSTITMPLFIKNNCLIANSSLSVNDQLSMGVQTLQQSGNKHLLFLALNTKQNESKIKLPSVLGSTLMLPKKSIEFEGNKSSISATSTVNKEIQTNINTNTISSLVKLDAQNSKEPTTSILKAHLQSNTFASNSSNDSDIILTNGSGKLMIDNGSKSPPTSTPTTTQLSAVNSSNGKVPRFSNVAILNRNRTLTKKI